MSAKGKESWRREWLTRNKSPRLASKTTSTRPDGPEVWVSTDLGPLEDVIFGWSYGDVGRREVALVEDAYLVRLKGTDDGMHDSSVMEKNEVLFLPFMGVHKLHHVEQHESITMRACRAYLRRNAGSQHLVEQCAYLPKMLDMYTIWVEGVLAFRPRREGLDNELPSDPQVNLEMKFSGNRVFP